jgi:hypothetical protein
MSSIQDPSMCNFFVGVLYMAASTSKSKKKASIVPKKPKVSSKKKVSLAAKKPFVNKPYVEVGGYKGKNFDPNRVYVKKSNAVVPKELLSKKIFVSAVKKVSTGGKLKDFADKALILGGIVGGGLLINKLIALNKNSVLELVNKRNALKEQIEKDIKNLQILINTSLIPTAVANKGIFMERKARIVTGFSPYADCSYANTIKKKVLMKLDHELSVLELLVSQAQQHKKNLEVIQSKIPQNFIFYFESEDTFANTRIKNKLLEQIWNLESLQRQLPSFGLLQTRQTEAIEKIKKAFDSYFALAFVKEIPQRCGVELNLAPARDPGVKKSRPI